MKYFRIILFVVLALNIACFNNETKNKKQKNQSVEKQQEVKLNTEAKFLMDYLNEMGDYANSRNFPSLIKASVVFEELGKNNLIIDIRKEEIFKKGHIEGAVNVSFSDIPEYFESKIKPFKYDRIIIACYSGQSSSYTTSLLRLMGYGNVYALRWGMSGWNKKLAEDSWLKGVSGEFETQLETKNNEKPNIGSFPELATNKTTGEEVLQARIRQLFELGTKEAMLSADKVFKDPLNYFIVNYDRRDKYESGHIQGAIRYKPKGTLGIEKEMATIPVNKDIVIYCGTGHNSGFVTAYLRLFGYNAHTLIYGNNSFMHDKMISEKEKLSWLPFTESLIKNYPVVKN